ncbi:hypothetical protein GTW59_10650, partial [Streptomyces sp. SID89]|nr:hypothetical protein [Streptomyces sp. SID89]
DPVEWPDRGRPRRAGVSSFGISGTNAHVVLEQAPEPVKSVDRGAVQAPARPAPPVLLSGNTPAALRRQAAALTEYLDAHPDTEPADLAAALARRARLAHGAALPADDP